MMPTDLVSVAPAGRDMMTSEADLASVVEATWHERSPRPNHCALPGAKACAHAAMEGSGLDIWVIAFLRSPVAAAAIRGKGLEPVAP
jgi:hypothetical protein